MRKRNYFGLVVAITMALAQASFAQNNAEIVNGVRAAAQMYKDGKVDEALSALEALEKKAPQDGDVLSWLGFVYIRKDKPADAVPILERAQKARPNDIEVMNNLGNAYVSTNQDEKALGQYENIAKLNTQMYEPYYNIGGIMLRRGSYDKAIEAYESALSRSTGDPFVYNNLGAAYEKSGNINKAMENYVHAASMRSDNLTFNRNAGLACLKANEVDKAIPYLSKVIDADSSDNAVKLALAEYYANKGENENAKKLLEGLSDKLGNNTTYWYNLGVVCFRLNDLDGAASAYKKAMELGSSDAALLNNYGLVLTRQGKFDDAIPVFEKLSGMAGASKDAQLTLASCYFRSGNTAKAVDSWKTYLRENPSRDDVRLELAAALWKSGDKEGARYHYVEVSKNQPNNARALNGIGLYQYDVEKMNEAASSFRKAIAADPNFLPSYNNLAVTLERLNKRAEGIKLLEKALEIDPNYEDARRNLERMKAAG